MCGEEQWFFVALICRQFLTRGDLGRVFRKTEIILFYFFRRADQAGGEAARECGLSDALDSRKQQCLRYPLALDHPFERGLNMPVAVEILKHGFESHPGLRQRLPP